MFRRRQPAVRGTFRAAGIRGGGLGGCGTGELHGGGCREAAAEGAALSQRHTEGGLVAARPPARRQGFGLGPAREVSLRRGILVGPVGAVCPGLLPFSGSGGLLVEGELPGVAPSDVDAARRGPVRRLGAFPHPLGRVDQNDGPL